MPPLPPPPPVHGGRGGSGGGRAPPRRRATLPPPSSSSVRDGDRRRFRRRGSNGGNGKGSTLRILICSGNLGNAEPSPNSVRAWLPPDGAVSTVVENAAYPIPDEEVGSKGSEGGRRWRRRGGGGGGAKKEEEADGEEEPPLPDGRIEEAEPVVDGGSSAVGDDDASESAGSGGDAAFVEAAASSGAPVAASASAPEATAAAPGDDDGGGKGDGGKGDGEGDEGRRSDPTPSTSPANLTAPPRESPKEGSSTTTDSDAAPGNHFDDDVVEPPPLPRGAHPNHWRNKPFDNDDAELPSPPRAHPNRRNKPFSDASSDRTDNTGRTDRTQKIDNTRTAKESGYFDVIVIGMQEATFGRKDLEKREKKEEKREKKEAKAKLRESNGKDGTSEHGNSTSRKDSLSSGGSLGVSSTRASDFGESDPCLPDVDDLPSRPYPRSDPGLDSAPRRRKKKHVKHRRRNTATGLVSAIAKVPKKMVKRTHKEARKIGERGITTFNQMAGDRNHAKGNNASLDAVTNGPDDGGQCDGQPYGGLQTVLGPYKAVVEPAVATIPINAIINPSFDDVLGTQTLHSLFQRRCPSYAFPVLYQRGEMRLAVGVRKDKVGEVGNVEVKAENTGLGSVMANKGGIAATLTIRKTRLSFLAAHLEAHEGRDHYKGRCSDIEEILEGTRPTDLHDLTTTSHHMFILGDVNFRIDLPPPPPPLPPEPPSPWHNEPSPRHNHKETEKKPKKWDSKEHARVVRGMVSRREWKRLNEADELRRALRDEDCLVGFRTLPCYFPPTFKVERKAGFQYQPKRTPSYTDRILWKSNHGLANKLRPIVYEPIELFETSDHKPIRGAFTIDTNGGRPAVKPEPRRISMPPNNVLDESPNHSAPQNLHIFVTEMQCANLTAKNLIDGKSNPYIMFVSDPKDLLRHDRTTALKFATKLGLAHHRTRQNEDGTKDRTHKGWPRTRKLYGTLDPDWGDDEIHLVIRHPFRNSTEESELDLTGAMLYLTVMDFDSTIGDEVIGTVALSLTSLSGSMSEGSMMKLNSGVKALPGTNTSAIDEPLLNNGKVQGRLRCTIFTWFLEDCEESAMLAKRKLELRGGRKSECVVS